MPGYTRTGCCGTAPGCPGAPGTPGIPGGRVDGIPGWPGTVPSGCPGNPVMPGYMPAISLARRGGTAVRTPDGLVTNAIPGTSPPGIRVAAVVSFLSLSLSLSSGCG